MNRWVFRNADEPECPRSPIKYVIHVFGDTPMIRAPGRPGDECHTILEPGCRVGALPGEVWIPERQAKAFVVHGDKVLELRG